MKSPIDMCRLTAKYRRFLPVHLSKVAAYNYIASPAWYDSVVNTSLLTSSLVLEWNSFTLSRSDCCRWGMSYQEFVPHRRLNVLKFWFRLSFFLLGAGRGRFNGLYWHDLMVGFKMIPQRFCSRRSFVRFLTVFISHTITAFLKVRINRTFMVRHD